MMTKRFLTSAALAAAMCGLMPGALAAESLEYQLATINAKTYVPKDHITVARFRSLLSQLDATYVEDAQRIADITVKAQEILRKDGIEESLINIMEGMNQVLSTRVENQRYAEYAAAYTTLRNSGQTHGQAIGGLRSLIGRITSR